MYSIKDKQSSIKKNHYIYSDKRCALISLVFIIFVTKTLCELSLTNLKAVTLLNGDIFIIHEKSVDVYDSTLTNKKSEYLLDSSMQVSSFGNLSKTTISIFPKSYGGYVISIIRDYIFFFYENGTLLHQINTTADLEGEYYSLVPFKIEGNEYYYIVAFGIGENVENCYMRLIYYKFNIESKENIKIYDNTVIYSDNNKTALLVKKALTCELMSTSSENLLTCFFVPNINPITVRTSSYRPDSNFSLVEEYNLIIPLINSGKYLKSAVSSDKKTALVCFYLAVGPGIYCNAYNIDLKKFTYGILYSSICEERIYENHVNFYIDTNQFIVSCPSVLGKVQIVVYDLNFNVLHNKTYFESCTAIDAYSIVYSKEILSYILLSDLGFCQDSSERNKQLIINFTDTEYKEEEEEKEKKEQEEESVLEQEEENKENEIEEEEMIDPFNINNYCSKKKTCVVDLDLSDDTESAVKRIENIIKNLNINDSTIIIYNGDKIFSISESDNQVINQNLSSIDLGNCEKTLKEKYSINSNDPLLILKLDIKIDYKTSVQYNVYNPYTKEKLDLSVCENNTITIYSPINLDDSINNKYEQLNDQNYDLFNSNDSFYNDLCTQFTTENDTDILLSDRKNDYYNSSLELCEENCEYKSYDLENKNVVCDCKIKTNLNTNETDIKFLANIAPSDFFDISKFSNLQVIKCYKLIFSKKGLIKNIGSYLLISISVIYLGLTIFFMFNGYEKIKRILVGISNNLIKNKRRKSRRQSLKSVRTIAKNSNPIKRKSINDISVINNKNGNELSIRSNVLIINNNSNICNFGKSNKKKSKKRKSTFNGIILEDELKTKKMEEKNKEEKIKEIKELTLHPVKYKNDKTKKQEKKENSEKQDKTKNNEKNKMKVYNDGELNSLSYKEAIKIDHRTYLQYYWSLLKTKHIILFTFFYNTDYNELIIKICLFLFNLALYFTVSACFFTDDTMHNIYAAKGAFKIISELPQMIYSVLISSVINTIVKTLSLSEKEIINLKRKKLDNPKKELMNVLNCFKIKYLVFYTLSFLLLFFFWYFIAGFCAVYPNTQVIMIKETFTSYGMSLLYPIGLNLIPGLFRIPSLKDKEKKKECLYKISGLVAII